VNADIMLMDDFSRAVERVASISPLMMIGRRWDTDIRSPWDFQAPDWQKRLLTVVRERGKQDPAYAIDYFLFTKGLGLALPPMAIGRPYWDNWMIWRARQLGVTVVDASAVVTAIHQSHDYSHHVAGWSGVRKGEDAVLNYELAGNPAARTLMTEDATHRLMPNGLVRSYNHEWQALRRIWRHPRTLIGVIRDAIAERSKI
jgi:hypothetical protein